MALAPKSAKPVDDITLPSRALTLYIALGTTWHPALDPAKLPLDKNVLIHVKNRLCCNVPPDDDRARHFSGGPVREHEEQLSIFTIQKSPIDWTVLNCIVSNIGHDEHKKQYPVGTLCAGDPNWSAEPLRRLLRR